MGIPFMRLDRQFAEQRTELLLAAEAVFTHGRVLQGPEVSELETRLATLHDLPHAVAVNSGTDALMLTLRALGLRRGGRVAVTSLSFIASASAVVHAGGIPVFVDIDDYYQAREADVLELVLNRKVDGVVAVHLYGQMTDLSRIWAEARERGIFVVEDAAQCLGARRHGRPPGGCSDATCISFDPTKVIGAYGSGGGVLTGDADLAARVRRLRYHGSVGNGAFGEPGFNSQMATVQAALLCVKLRQLDRWQDRRTEIAERYTRRFGGRDGLTVPEVMEGNVHNFHKFVLRVPSRRDHLKQHLADRAIQTRIHYPVPLHKQPCFAGQGETFGNLRGVETATGEILSLPIYPELTDGEVDAICREVDWWITRGTAPAHPKPHTPIGDQH